MAVQLTSTRDIAAARLTALVYGESGVGKTSLAKTCPGRVLIISAESGLLSLAGTEIDVIEIGSWEDVREVSAWLSEPRAYDWLFIDSITEVAQRLVEDLKLRYPDRRDSFPMWGEYNDTMRAFVKRFRDLRPYNVVFTALPKVEKDDVGRRFVGIDVSGKIGDQLPQFFDEVFSLRVLTDAEGVEARWLVTDTHDSWIGKDRSGKLELFERPDLAAVAAKTQTSRVGV